MCIPIQLLIVYLLHSRILAFIKYSEQINMTYFGYMSWFTTAQNLSAGIGEQLLPQLPCSCVKYRQWWLATFDTAIFQGRIWRHRWYFEVTEFTEQAWTFRLTAWILHKCYRPGYWYLLLFDIDLTGWVNNHLCVKITQIQCKANNSDTYGTKLPGFIFICSVFYKCNVYNDKFIPFCSFTFI